MRPFLVVTVVKYPNKNKYNMFLYSVAIEKIATEQKRYFISHKHIHIYIFMFPTNMICIPMRKTCMSWLRQLLLPSHACIIRCHRACVHIGVLFHNGHMSYPITKRYDVVAHRYWWLCSRENPNGPGVEPGVQFYRDVRRERGIRPCKLAHQFGFQRYVIEQNITICPKI